MAGRGDPMSPPGKTYRYSPPSQDDSKKARPIAVVPAGDGEFDQPGLPVIVAGWGNIGETVPSEMGEMNPIVPVAPRLEEAGAPRRPGEQEIADVGVRQGHHAAVVPHGWRPERWLSGRAAQPTVRGHRTPRIVRRAPAAVTPPAVARDGGCESSVGRRA